MLSWKPIANQKQGSTSPIEMTKRRRFILCSKALRGVHWTVRKLLQFSQQLSSCGLESEDDEDEDDNRRGLLDAGDLNMDTSLSVFEETGGSRQKRRHTLHQMPGL